MLVVALVALVLASATALPTFNGFFSPRAPPPPPPPPAPPAPFFQAPAPRPFKFAQQAPAPRPTKFFQAPPPQKFVQQTPRSTDCVYGSWTQWSECTAACGESAFISRTRVVLAEAAGYGAQCEPSQLEEWQSCQGDICQSDCVMGQWTSWSQCSADCGQGSRQRWRQIVAQPINGGLACGPTDEPEPCNAGPCPVDCQMSQWSGWSQCSALCGPGSRQRLRSVLVQSAFGGQECGPVEDWEQCNGNTCATPCQPGQWSSWSQCPSCGQANRQRSRSIAVRATNGGAQCLPNDLFESESCNNVPCPVPCQMAQWSGWSQCSSDCGEGRRQRLRSVLVPAAFGGQSCGPAEEWEGCSNGPCARDCELGAWSSWSQCPSCGQASRSRSRPVVVQAAFGGQQCDFASLAESESCQIQPCPVNCQMAQWSGWSQCSSDCGEGRRQRLRSVQIPAAFGGLSCGPAEEWEACSNGPCSVDCVVSQWSQWSACSADCGQGSRQRLRSVLTPASNDGKACPNVEDWAQCNNGPCRAPSVCDGVFGQRFIADGCTAEFVLCSGGVQHPKICPGPSKFDIASSTCKLPKDIAACAAPAPFFNPAPVPAPAPKPFFNNPAPAPQPSIFSRIGSFISYDNTVEAPVSAENSTEPKTLNSPVPIPAPVVVAPTPIIPVAIPTL